ncbi:C40 family peptidase [Flavobacterium sp. UMI-01]|uniref:C40 family peptidase n=1 Tax=Flavobacterium sp. UMI-01 TaxID=1441053 RepID=UPI001C7DAE55|nr:C40 family peptidase [Flavobacterium sp. UMI-01]GIZ09101.1 hypothetical protein FUMI01_18280 [Flavobacterium sp. UMI-01]
MKYVLPLLAFLFLVTSCKSTSSASKNNAALADKIVRHAVQHLGAPYKPAGKTSSGFDCSGLVYSTFGAFDINLPRTSYEQATAGKSLGKNTAQAEKGDLIFFKTNRSSRINHVGIVTEADKNEVKFIHSSTTKGVIISSTKESYYEKSFTQLTRILE